MLKRLICGAMCVLLLLSISLTAFADETENTEAVEMTQISISNVNDFLAFAENCRLDTYSQNLLVSLEADIDLSSEDFAGIPIFSGTFDGKGHTISGLTIGHTGSVQGLFRYLTLSAVVQNLHLLGSIHPAGSQNKVGAIAGQNAGSVLHCSFSGSVSGGDYVGGLVGVNTVTGIIEHCNAEGQIYADHFVGGIAGENCGVIRSCGNDALINTTPQQNSVELSGITMDTLTNTEAANTVTDIGGIAGISSGVIRDCINRGDVGYRHMGYNIGGIAGTQSGYLTNCENHGNVQGRKEVGGIVGQMEPSAQIEYSDDTLQILQEQFNQLSGMVYQVSGKAQTNADRIHQQIGLLKDQASSSRDAIDSLIPDGENPELPDPDKILAAQNTLSKTVNDMAGTLGSIASDTDALVNGLTQDLNRISGQLGVMGNTINGASENLGGSVLDISDSDTAEDLIGKVEQCVNYGDVLADLNAGGIAGAMAMENDLDLLEDWEKTGEESLNFQSQLRAVILSCENQGTVSGKKNNAGGVAGLQTLGLIKSCINTGKLDCTDAKYVGGISGLSTGYIRNNWVKCEIHAGSYAGGIAGSAGVVSDCMAQVKLIDVTEYLGAVLGIAEEKEATDAPIRGNYYLRADEDYGAIDGISYCGQAEPLKLEEFTAVEGLPQVFQTVTVRFVLPDGKATEIFVLPGTKLDIGSIPDVPVQNGKAGQWEGLAEALNQDMLFDMTFEAVYTSYSSTIQSQQTRDNGLPLVLLEGSFTELATVSLESAQVIPKLAGKEVLLEAWTLTMSEEGNRARFLLPDEVKPDSAKLMILGANQQWRTVDVTFNGSYVVFDVMSGDQCLALVQKAADHTLWIIAGACAFILLLPVVVFVVWKLGAGKRNKKKEQTNIK